MARREGGEGWGNMGVVWGVRLNQPRNLWLRLGCPWGDLGDGLGVARNRNIAHRYWG